MGGVKGSSKRASLFPAPVPLEVASAIIGTEYTGRVPDLWVLGSISSQCKVPALATALHTAFALKCASVAPVWRIFPGGGGGGEGRWGPVLGGKGRET